MWYRISPSLTSFDTLVSKRTDLTENVTQGALCWYKSTIWELKFINSYIKYANNYKKKIVWTEEYYLLHFFFLSEITNKYRVLKKNNKNEKLGINYDNYWILLIYNPNHYKGI